MPATDDADIYVKAIAECYASILADGGKPLTVDSISDRLQLWTDRWAPHLTEPQVRDIASRAIRLHGRFLDNETVGRRLRLLHAERAALKITRIGCCDVDRAARKRLAKERKRERDRLRAAAKRSAAGAKTRAEYLAGSVERSAPWKALGISRRAFYYRRKKGLLTEASPQECAA